MEKRALLKYARITPMKARRVMDLIRGKSAGEAMVSLRFMPYRGARLVEKVLRSAMANAEQGGAPDAEQLKISKAFADAGPVMKRMRARAMGRGNIIKKRMSHLSIHLSDEEK
jgi:large subunit ribosomal protein L22